MPKQAPEEWLPRRRRRRRSPRTVCPHCGRLTPTVRGTCTECWGSKGERRRLFTIKKRGPRASEDGPESWFPGCLTWPVLAIVAALALFILAGWT